MPAKARSVVGSLTPGADQAPADPMSVVATFARVSISSRSSAPNVDPARIASAWLRRWTSDTSSGLCPLRYG